MKFVLGFILGILLSVSVNFAHAEPRFNALYRHLEIFSEVLANIENYYIEKPVEKSLIYGAAKGLSKSLDAHSAFFTPDEFQMLTATTEGEYAGVGFELEIEEDFPTVTFVAQNSPAQKANIRVGDKITAVNGEATYELNIEEIVLMLRGPVNSKVTLQIYDGRKVKEIILTRRFIRVESLEQRMLTQDIAYVRIKTFSKDVHKELEQSLKLAKKGLVLDLRGNPGGLFEEAVAVSDLFLQNGLIVSAVGREGESLGEQRAVATNTFSTLPLTLLVDRNSASASEIVAGALQDHKRAKIIGEKTYGKGSVQSLFRLSDGSGLKLTVAKYQTPKGTFIDGKGIQPDILVKAELGEDRVLNAALQVLQHP